MRQLTTKVYKKSERNDLIKKKTLTLHSFTRFHNEIRHFYMKPLVSVIVPNYNYAHYLPQRLDSILGQTYDNIEVIILDDHSTDNSIEVIQRYASDPRITQVVINETNSGTPFKQWWRGINLAKGDIIWIAEADDYCTNDMLEKLVATYVAHDCTIAFARSRVIDEHDEQLYIYPGKFKKDQSWNGVKFIKKHMGVGNRICNASGVIFSRQAALEAGTAFTGFKAVGDWMFWIEIALKGNVAVVAEPLNRFRRSTTTCTTKANRCGTSDIEDHKVFDSLIHRSLISRYHAFIKQKRMAKLIYYSKDRYSNNDIKQMVQQTWNLAWYYRLIAKCSLLLKQI